MVYTKSLLSPGYYRTGKKTNKFVITSSPGPHKKSKSIPLAIALRNILNLAENRRESREILGKRFVKVDNKVRTDHRFPIGFMDVLSINNSVYRVLIGNKGLCIKPVKKDQSSVKLLKVIGKKYNKNKKLQISLHDGKTMIVDKDIYKTGDVILFDIDNKKIKDVIQFKRGSTVLIIDGKNKGKLGKIEDIVVVKGSQPNKVVIKLGNDILETYKDYVFIVGQDSPVINVEV